MGNFVFEEVSKIFRDSAILAHLYETLITLISKCLNADCLTSFRPISLCNIVYKVVTKIIVKRLRPMLPKLISPLPNSLCARKNEVGQHDYNSGNYSLHESQEREGGLYGNKN